MRETAKPIRVVFTKGGEPIRLHPDGKTDQILWTADGRQWLDSVEGPFPYECCEERFVETEFAGPFALHILKAIP